MELDCLPLFFIHSVTYVPLACQVIGRGLYYRGIAFMKQLFGF